ncbi:MAG: hypothetical protein M1830_006580 [Pleopsidium flavum]|nr:MAG: hypothetical protein M1830_006580 [Pleopsidium flavum]
MTIVDGQSNIEDKEVNHVENPASNPSISEEHEEYLLGRHGTLELTPLPSFPPEDPLNWPGWKKDTQLLMVAFHAMVTTFTAAGIIPGFPTFAKRYGTSIEEASYLASVEILFLGIFPFVWSPISKRFGRRPVFLISTFGSCICNIGGVFCTSYGAQMTTRVLMSILICPPLGMGSGVVTELFFSHERAQKMGWWTLMTTLGTPGGPFIIGFVVKHIGINWIFWIFAIINFCQFLGYLLLDAETLHDRSSARPRPMSGHLNFGRIDSTPSLLEASLRLCCSAST